MIRPGVGECFHRRVALRRVDATTVSGSVEDDFHHFIVTIGHRHDVVRSVDAETRRAPWSTCPAASVPLGQLVGRALIERASDVGMLIDMRVQCTHMFDLAGLLLAFASRDDESLTNDAFVARDGATQHASLERTGIKVLRWTIHQDCVVEAEQALGRGFREWTEMLPLEQAEWAFVLRRAVFVSQGRSEVLEEWKGPDDLGLPVGAFHTLGAGVRSTARRVIGMRIDYAASVRPAGG